VDISNCIVDLVEHYLEVSNVTPLSAFNRLDADSLDIIEIVLLLEDKFDIEIADSDVDYIVTVGDMIDVVNEKLIK